MQYYDSTRKSLSTSDGFWISGVIAIEARTKEKKPARNHLYDDETIENMMRYYKVEDNFDSLLRYIKSNNPRNEGEL